jgi:hypothetical protein
MFKKLFILTILVSVTTFAQFKRQYNYLFPSNPLDTLGAKELRANGKSVDSVLFKLREGAFLSDTNKQLLKSDSTIFTSVYQNSLKLNITDTTNKWQPKGTYLVPSDSVLMRNYSNLLYQPIGTYLVPSDTNYIDTQLGLMALKSTTLSAGTGISATGLGDLSTNRTINVDTTFLVTKWDTLLFTHLNSFSSLATGLTYTNTTGAFSLTSGYVIPTTTEETNWATAYTRSGLLCNDSTNWNSAYTYRVTSANLPISLSSNVLSLDTTSTGVATRYTLRDTAYAIRTTLNLKIPYSDTTSVIANQWRLGGYVPITRTLTVGYGINTIGDLSANRTISGDTTNAQATTTRTGYLLYTNFNTFNLAATRAGLLVADSTNWNTAYTDRLKWDGGATGLVAATGRTSLELKSMALSDSTWDWMKKSDTTSLSNRINAKEPTITAGTTAQYWRGDKSWQTLNYSAVGLGSISLCDSVLFGAKYYARGDTTSVLASKNFLTNQYSPIGHTQGISTITALQDSLTVKLNRGEATTLLALKINYSDTTSTIANQWRLNAYTPITRTLSAGVGISSTGLGDLSTNRTINIDTTTVMASKSFVSNQYQVKGTYLVPNDSTLNRTWSNLLYSPIVGSNSIVTTGVLNAGSITSGFGSIDIGTDALGCGAITSTGVVTASSATFSDTNSTSLGSEIVSDPGFDTGTGWTLDASSGTAISGSQLTCIRNANLGYADQTLSLSANTAYLITYVVVSQTGNETSLRDQLSNNIFYFSKSAGTYYYVYTPTINITKIRIVGAANPSTSVLSSFSIKPVGGNVVVRGIITGGGTTGIKVDASGNTTFAGTINSGAITSSGNVAVNGGSITSTASTLNLGVSGNRINIGGYLDVDTVLNSVNALILNDSVNITKTLNVTGDITGSANLITNRALVTDVIASDTVKGATVISTGSIIGSQISTTTSISANADTYGAYHQLTFNEIDNEGNYIGAAGFFSAQGSAKTAGKICGIYSTATQVGGSPTYAIYANGETGVLAICGYSLDGGGVRGESEFQGLMGISTNGVGTYTSSTHGDALYAVTVDGNAGKFDGKVVMYNIPVDSTGLATGTLWLKTTDGTVHRKW